MIFTPRNISAKPNMCVVHLILGLHSNIQNTAHNLLLVWFIIIKRGKFISFKFKWYVKNSHTWMNFNMQSYAEVTKYIAVAINLMC